MISTYYCTSLSTCEGHSQSKTGNRANVDYIDLHYVYAVLPVHNRSGWLLKGDESQSTTSISDLSTLSPNSPLRGFQLYTYEAMDDGTLQEIIIVFQSNLPRQIQRWYELLSKIIAECTNAILIRIVLSFTALLQINQ
jgi:hypothetical protein